MSEQTFIPPFDRQDTTRVSSGDQLDLHQPDRARLSYEELKVAERLIQEAYMGGTVEQHTVEVPVSPEITLSPLELMQLMSKNLASARRQAQQDASTEV